ncbi:hypothetical protein [Vibrio parahaemolyticus]|uniref:hypothetical protein n=1 Tax=Vibrio parahaemolyticus TaxID=670 RepID=UPI00387B1835
MHPLQNGSQVTERPAYKPGVGLAGWFTESGENNVPSFPGADWFNHVIAEFQNALNEQGIEFNPANDDHFAQMFSKGRKVGSVSEMISTQFRNGDTCSTGGTSWLISENSSGLPLDNGLYAEPISDIFFDDFDGDDKASEIRRAVGLIERIGYPIKITGSGKLNLLKSPETTVNGIKCALAITKPNLVRLDSAMLDLRVDINTPSMAGLDAVIAVVPSTSDESSYIYWGGLRVEGGNWPLVAQRPKNLIKADYFTLRYAYFDDCRFRFSSEHNVHMSAFVVLANKMRGSFAGPNHNNFNFVVNDIVGDSAARTGYLLNACTGDYAGMHNFSFSGANGHTYCHLNNCHGDFWGRDDAQQTIQGNVNTASAYHFENIRVITCTAIGGEKGGKLITGVNCRTLIVNGIYGVLCGNTSGQSIDSAMDFEGFCENVTISGFENRDSISTFDYDLSIANPAAFNTNTFTVDKSIPKSRINYQGGTRTSASTSLVISPEDTYSRGARKGAGDALVTGEKLIGNDSTNWFSQASSSAEQTFYMSTDGGSKTIPLLILTSPSDVAQIGFMVELNFFSLEASQIHRAPSKYIIGAGSTQAGQMNTSPSLVNSDGFDYSAPPVLAWNGNQLEITISTPFAVAFGRITATGRPSTGTQTFDWLI